MKIYDELVARGLIAQVTDEAEIRELIDNGRATFYIGFDPTADSLHVYRRPFGQNRYALHDAPRADSAQLRLL